MGALGNELRARGIRGPLSSGNSSCPQRAVVQSFLRDLLEQSCACFADALAAVVGPTGTICVPGFFYDYARKGLIYDTLNSPPDAALGTFPDYFFRRRMQSRSLNPLFNLITAGAQAEWLTALPSLYGNGPTSPWSRIVGAGGWMLFFGCTPAAMTFIHHVEHLVGVPHLYNKIYRIPVIDMKGQEYAYSVASVRYLDTSFRVTYALDKIGDELERAGLLVRGAWGSVSFSMAPMKPVQEYLIDRLVADPFALLQHPPSFIRGVIPDDGPDSIQHAETRSGKVFPRSSI
jgi:aminoglycoside 3-N-acetyltransferase